MRSRHSLRGLLGAAALCLAAAAGADELVVASWGGHYAAAQQAAFLDKFEKETGIKVRLDEFSGGLAEVRRQEKVGEVYWDIVDLEFADVVIGCEEGLLHEFAANEWPAPDGTTAREDYLFEAYSACGVAGIIYSTVITYQPDAFGKKPPTAVADFFDLTKFPGGRGMRRTPQGNLELALLADGVPETDVYEVLDTEEGQARAFRKLDQIKPHARWWDAVPEAMRMLTDDEVTMTTSFNGRVYHEVVVEDHPMAILWDGEILDSTQFAIVADTPRLENAKRFARFISKAENMAALGGHLPFNMVRRSANDLLTGRSTTGVNMEPFLPATEEHMRHGVWNNWSWWHDNLDELTERFAAWISD